MIAVHDYLDPIYSWSLTKDGNLVQSSTQPVFRTRIREQGNFVLNASVYNSTLTSSVQRQFFIRSNQPTVNTTNLGESFLEEILPTQKNGKVIVNEGIQTIKLVPNTSTKKRIYIDTNTKVDDNGDGNLTNDSVSNTLLFTSDATPLFIWFTKPIKDTTIALFEEGTDAIEQIRITNLETAQLEAIEEEKIKQNNPEIEVVNYSSNTIGFSLNIDQYSWSNEPLLLLWNFGDGVQSLLDRPIHTYAIIDNFNVTVDVRNLRTNEIIQTYKKTIAIMEIEMLQTSSSANSSSVQSISSESSVSSITESSTSSMAPSNNTNSTIWLILKLIGVSIGSILFGVLLVVLVHFFKKKNGVQTIIQKSEKKLIKDSVVDVNNEPPPMAVPEVDLDTEETEDAAPINTRPDFKDAVEAVETSDNFKTANATLADNSNSDSTPDWLQANKNSHETVDTVPSWLQSANTGQTEVVTPVTSVETNSSKEITTDSLQVADSLKTEVINEESENVPAWLRPNYSTDVKSNEDTSANIPNVPEIKEPAKAEDMPAWLQPKQSMNETETLSGSNVNTASNLQSSTETAIPDWLQPKTDTGDAINVNNKNIENNINNSPNLKAKVDNAVTNINNDETDESTMTDDNKEDTGKIPPEVWNKMSPEEKEQEKKRQKRRRYRQNKREKSIDQNETTTEDITVDNVANIPAVKLPTDANSIDAVPNSSTKEDTQTDALLHKPDVQMQNVNDLKNQENIITKEVEPITEGLNSNLEAVNTVTPLNPANAIKVSKPIEPTNDSTNSTSSTTEPAVIKTIVNEPVVTTTTGNEPSITKEKSTIPDWLAAGAAQAEAEGQTNTSVPPAILQDVPLVTPASATDDGDDVQFIIKADSLDESNTSA